MNKIICVANQKGGVGKTTTAVNLGACLAFADQRVLLIDIDPQGNATTSLGIARGQAEYNVYQAISTGTILPSMIFDTQVDKLKLIPSTPDLYGAEIELVNMENRERRVQNLVDQISDDFDFVIIDCPPSLGMLTLNALTAANSVIVPLQTEYFAMEGLSRLDYTIRRVKEAFNPDLEIEGILFTMVDGRTVLSQQVINEVKNHYGARVFTTSIPRNIKLSEAPSHGKPIILYDFKSKGSDAYIELAKELIQNNRTTACV